jgi:pre-rRNA-processing protein TSR3
MRSSGSTPSPLSRRPIRLLVRFLDEDDPRRCSGRRLLRRGLVRPIGGWERLVPSPITLDPFAAVVLSGGDRARAEAGGILAVDSSWNRISGRSRLLGEGERSPSPHARRLPLLVAGNPQHYGRWTQLTTAEALAAAVYVVGHAPEAETILEGIPGGPAFLEINRARLERFARAPSSQAAVEAERSIFDRAAGV